MESRFQGQLSSSIFSVPFSVETGIRISSENLSDLKFSCTAVRFFTASGRHAPFGLWPAHAMCILASSSLDSAQFLRCVLVVLAMSRPIFSRAPRMARLF